MIWQLSLRSLLPTRYEMGKRHVEADKKKANARAAAVGRRSMSKQV